ncbi:probable CCR4-associated factor 1 homolog 11 [Tripterygium wilfordii]|uniref:probable CCR4-associated factor 1 homolog 11 n=1 Tax=Tripterygium wilfordii TaxID=458696 RepID=UPI0018F81986|nr:probable CCR4-associated factor 1 homolog 11 [Tripterygium wilfordii]
MGEKRHRFCHFAPKVRGSTTALTYISPLYKTVVQCGYREKYGSCPIWLPGDMYTADKPPPPSQSVPIVIRSVWSDNLDYEFELIRSVVSKYRWFSMDTEFPGVVFKPVDNPANDNANVLHRNPYANYVTLKNNVDVLHLIQIGVTISDDEGNLPDLGTGTCYIWEFNFRDFDITRDDHAHDSVELLRRQGIDFERFRNYGIDSVRFAELMMSSGLVLDDKVSWVTFHCAYDFGYLVKILTQRPLPGEMSDFLNLVRVFFGPSVYDVKHLMRFCHNLHGGLDKVAKELNVERIGNSHHAGSDSLVTMQVFQKIEELYFCGGKIKKYANILYGLEVY